MIVVSACGIFMSVGDSSRVGAELKGKHHRVSLFVEEKRAAAIEIKF